VGKPISATKVTTRPVEPEDDVTDAANLKKDLELQRLLNESHLLERPSLTSTPSVNRDKVTDLRMQALGAKASLFVQQKMPLSHRRGIKAKAVMREGLRRKEAQENGVVLERASKGKQGDTRKRDRGIGTPAVGKFDGGTLKLSRKDIHEINGPMQTIRGRRKGKR
jgi:Domain of unknown function (DUF4602)